MNRLRLRLASPGQGTGLPIVNDPVASAEQLDKWQRSQRAREFLQATAVIAASLLVCGMLVLAVVWAAGLTPPVILLAVVEALAGLVFVVAVIVFRRRRVTRSAHTVNSFL